MATKRAALMVSEGSSNGVTLRHRLFHKWIRAAVQHRLERQGKTPAEVNALMKHVTDDMIDMHAKDNGVSVGAIGDGTFLQWIKDHGPEILKLIETILGILAMFG